jgi:hypothetical protein
MVCSLYPPIFFSDTFFSTSPLSLLNLPPPSPLGHISNPLYLDSPATFAYVFGNRSLLKTPSLSSDQPSLPPQSQEEDFSYPSFGDIDYVNDFDREALATEENETDFSAYLLAQQESDEDQYSTPSFSSPQPPSPPIFASDPSPPQPYPQSSSSLSHAIPIFYQLEVPSASATNELSTPRTTLLISNESSSSPAPAAEVNANMSEWNRTTPLSNSNPSRQNSVLDRSDEKIPSILKVEPSPH